MAGGDFMNLVLAVAIEGCLLESIRGGSCAVEDGALAAVRDGRVTADRDEDKSMMLYAGVFLQSVSLKLKGKTTTMLST